jgi:DNA-binding NtrC family response regulator
VLVPRRLVLIVGGDGASQHRLTTHLRRRGAEVRTPPDCGAALEAIEAARPEGGGAPDVHAVLLDPERPGFAAQAFREMLRLEHPSLPLLDLPPPDAGPEEVGLLAAAIVQDTGSDPAVGTGLVEEEDGFETPLHGYKFEDLNSRSPKMLELFEVIPRVAQTDSAVLIMGETGTGKELVAAAIHRQSKRAHGEFFTINCGALTESLLESELFGHERGAFTGAVRSKKGYFELASGGTLFLDELGTISHAMQVRLLRVLERHEIRRVGGTHQRPVDVRIVAATNARLEESVKDGSFREDLYYRLNVVTMRIPPLRERPEDVPLLADVFREKFAKEVGRREVSSFEPTAIRLLKAYNWPGNVRELEHVIERAVIMTRGTRIRGEDFPERLRRTEARRSTSIPSFDIEEPLSNIVTRVRSAVEQEYLRRVLKRYKGHLGRAARHAGVNRRTLYNKMQSFGLRREDFR